MNCSALAIDCALALEVTVRAQLLFHNDIEDSGAESISVL